MMDGKPLTVKELARELRLPQSSLYEYAKKGLIPGHRVGRHYIFFLNEVLESTRFGINSSSTSSNG